MTYEPSAEANPYRLTEYEDAYEGGVGDPQSFIDRHPHGFPAMTMQQYGVGMVGRPRRASASGRLEGYGIWPAALPEGR